MGPSPDWAIHFLLGKNPPARGWDHPQATPDPPARGWDHHPSLPRAVSTSQGLRPSLGRSTPSIPPRAELTPPAPASPGACGPRTPRIPASPPLHTREQRWQPVIPGLAGSARLPQPRHGSGGSSGGMLCPARQHRSGEGGAGGGICPESERRSSPHLLKPGRAWPRWSLWHLKPHARPVRWHLSSLAGLLMLMRSGMGSLSNARRGGCAPSGWRGSDPAAVRPLPPRIQRRRCHLGATAATVTSQPAPPRPPQSQRRVLRAGERSRSEAGRAPSAPRCRPRASEGLPEPPPGPTIPAAVPLPAHIAFPHILCLPWQLFPPFWVYPSALSPLGADDSRSVFRRSGAPRGSPLPGIFFFPPSLLPLEMSACPLKRITAAHGKCHQRPDCHAALSVAPA